jgi:hypothetical protein
MKMILAMLMTFSLIGCKNSSSTGKNKYPGSSKNHVNLGCKKNATMTLTRTIGGFQPNCVSLAVEALEGMPSFMLSAMDKASMTKDKPAHVHISILNEYPVPGIYKIGTNFLMEEEKFVNSDRFDAIKNFQISFGMGELLCMNYGGGSLSQKMAIAGTLELTKVSPGRGGRLAGNFDFTCQNQRIAGSFDASDYLVEIPK